MKPALHSQDYATPKQLFHALATNEKVFVTWEAEGNPLGTTFRTDNQFFADLQLFAGKLVSAVTANSIPQEILALQDIDTGKHLCVVLPDGKRYYPKPFRIELLWNKDTDDFSGLMRENDALYEFLKEAVPDPIHLPALTYNAVHRYKRACLVTTPKALASMDEEFERCFIPAVKTAIFASGRVGLLQLVDGSYIQVYCIFDAKDSLAFCCGVPHKLGVIGVGPWEAQPVQDYHLEGGSLDVKAHIHMLRCMQINPEEVTGLAVG